ncbi:polysaccharide deacetylase family protein [Janthinobacterium fluminis]|uniref:Polysaccharide deacetylase family protein n=1 Tax=Janthinobacterium fluminis TaxID=2987524 RepID=A0ABT5JXT0_9BURK|nr:polysaccharide deacetylase family protein [Janthinobacterium fluminis]MDC8756851.1 polysaccharide deacetylase family protein [Janthinobacterium fluminis]
MRRWPAPTLSVLIYHRVLARADPLLPAEPDGAAFERQLRLLKRCFTLLPLGEAVRRLRDGGLPARAASLTFDDGYADNAEVALPLLQKHGLSACFFIAGGYLDGGMMWNDRIIERVRRAGDAELDLTAHGLGRHPLGSAAQRCQAIASILGSLKYLPFAQRQASAAAIHGDAGEALMMSSAQVRALARAGMEIGGHTERHPILATQTEAEARSDIADGKRRLEALIQAPLTLFAYPNGKAGRDYDGRHVAIVRALGFEAAVATDSGVARPGCDLFQLPRFTPWERNRLRFMLRMAQNMLRP